jgi:hypothetical protein
MKGKKLTYVLLVGVVLVWGIIFIRVYQSLFGNSGDAVGVRPVVRKEHTYVTKDTFTLIAKYRDPFLGNAPNILKATVTSGPVRIASPKPREVPKPLEPEVKIDYSFISYIGLIKNPGNNKNVSLMSIRGKEYLMEEGTTKDDVKLVKNHKDSVLILYNGKEKYIKRN